MNPNGSTFKVLVIDDSNTIRRSAEMFLRQAGYEVILAEDGFDALSKISDYQPRIIFVDVMMPRLDGYQTCAIIKRNQCFAGVPVIMLSSKDGLFDRARGMLAGANAYLTKPFTKEQLLRAVQQFGAGPCFAEISRAFEVNRPRAGLLIGFVARRAKDVAVWQLHRLVLDGAQDTFGQALGRAPGHTMVFAGA